MASVNNNSTNSNPNQASTSQGDSDHEQYDDENSVASSAGTLQMSMLENKLESEISKMGEIMQNTLSSLSEYMNQKLTELDTKLNNLAADLQPTGQNLNLNSSVAQTVQSNCDMNTPVIASNSHSRGDNSYFKMKPQNFSGAEDFDEFLSQFEITCEINRWQYREKSLYLANCLTGEARSLLSELDPDGRRDYSTLVEKLTNRFGSVNRSEIFRTQLKSRVRNKGESIPQLAQAVKKLVRQAYPGVNKDVVETLSIDHFIDAMTDSEIRLRVREFGPKTLGDAERTALRLESHKIADRQRSRLVGQVEVDSKQDKNENAKDANNEIKTLKSSLDALTSYVKDLTRPSKQIHDNSFRNGKFQPGQTFNRNGRYGRQYQSNPPPSHGLNRSSGGQQRSNNSSHRNDSHQAQSSNGPVDYASRNRQNNTFWSANPRYGSSRHENNQGNENQSVWRATNRQH